MSYSETLLIDKMYMFTVTVTGGPKKEEIPSLRVLDNVRIFLGISVEKGRKTVLACLRE